MDGFPEASMDGFTAVRKMPLRSGRPQRGCLSMKSVDEIGLARRHLEPVDLLVSARESLPPLSLLVLELLELIVLELHGRAVPAVHGQDLPGTDHRHGGQILV